MDNLIPVTLRHARLAAIVTAHAAAAPAPDSTLGALFKTYNAEPIQLRRTRETRSLSRERYRRAEGFILSAGDVGHGDWPNFLYLSGVTAQLVLSSHLLDVGFADDWCARHIGLHVARSLAYANATGLGCDCAETARLAQVLTPYWKWNARALADTRRPNDGGFTCEQVRGVLGALLDQVAQVTGHARTPRRVSKKAALPV